MLFFYVKQTPFVDMLNGPMDSVLNILLFLPLGFFIPLLFKKYHRISQVAWIGFLFSLSIELIQMFGHRATDINDLITNTIGTCIEYGLYLLLNKFMRKELKEKFQAHQIKDDKEMLFFAVYAFLIMVTIQPYIIHTFFQLG